MRLRVLVAWLFAVLFSTIQVCCAGQTQKDYESRTAEEWEQEKSEREQKNNQLLQAVQIGDAKQVAALLKYPFINVFVRDPKGSPVVMLAIENGRADIVSLLVNHRAWVYYDGSKFADLGEYFETGTDARGKAALTLAEEKRNREMLQLVRDAALVEACLQADFATIKKLVSQSANVNGNNSLKEKPLSTALESDSNLFEYENNGAREAEKYRIVKYLLQKGAKPTTEVLCLAAVGSPLEIFDLMLKKGADAKARVSALVYNYNVTLPMYLLDVLWRHRSEDVMRKIEMLLRAGADVNAQDAQGRTLLMRGLDARQNGLLKLFLQKGAKVGLRDHDGQTALHWAAKRRAVDAVITLLRHGADVNQRTLKGDTPLLLAVGQLSVRESATGPVFDDGFDIGASALATVQALIHAGAKVSFKNAESRTALDIARLKLKNGRYKKDYAAIVTLLQAQISSTR